jgi:hypothetical protein
MVSKDTQTDTETNEKQRSANPGVPLIDSPDFAQQSKAKQLAKHASRKLKKGLKRATIWPWLTIIPAAAAVIYTIFAVRQWYVTRDQLRVMQTEQRPWVEIKSAQLDDIVLGGDGDSINIQMSFDIKNIGKTPALGIEVRVAPYVTSQKTFSDANTLQERKCAESKDYPSRKSDLSLMPEQPDTIHVGAVISMAQAIADADNEFAEWAKHMNADASAKRTPYRHDVAFMVLGCFDYFLASSQDHGQTFFRYSVVRPKDGLPYGIHLPIAGTLVPPNVGMTKEMWGNYAR